MILLLRIRRRCLTIDWYLIRITLRLLPCLLPLCSTYFQARTLFCRRPFRHTRAWHQLQSRSHNLILTVSLFISGIRRRSPTSGTPRTLLSTPERVASIHGHRPTYAKSLSLGEYIFLIDITFMFTHSFQLSVLILFHCTIHASLFSFLAFFLCVWKTLRKTKKIISCSF